MTLKYKEGVSAGTPEMYTLPVGRDKICTHSWIPATNSDNARVAIIAPARGISHRLTLQKLREC